MGPEPVWVGASDSALIKTEVVDDYEGFDATFWTAD